MEDCYEEVLCYFSCFVVGAIAVPLYEGLRGADLYYMIEQTTPKVIFTSKKLASHLNDTQQSFMVNIPIFQIDNESSDNCFNSLLIQQETNCYHAE